MKRIVYIISIALVIGCFSSSAFAQFKLYEVRAHAGMSRTSVHLATIDESSLLPFDEDKTISGVPLGLRFTLASSEYGFALNLGGFIQPMFVSDENTEYYVSPQQSGQGLIDNTFWDMGVSGILTYRLREGIRGLYFGAGIGGHKIVDKSSFVPVLQIYLEEDLSLPIEELNDSEFRIGGHFLIGMPIHSRIAIEAQYEHINDFSQYKIGLAIALYQY